MPLKHPHPSVARWALSFLAVDAAFWLFLVGGCLVNRVDCVETFTFGPYLFYLPVAVLLDAVTTALGQQILWPFPAVVALLGVLGVASHALVGGLIGWLLRMRRVAWTVTVPAALAIVLGVSYVPALLERREEMRRETVTRLLEIVEPTADSFSYHEVTETLTPDGPGPVSFASDEGLGWQHLENTRRTKVQLICNAPSCAEVAVDGYVEIGWDAYVAAHDACRAEPTTCPYYSLGTYDLFDVQMDPDGILVMTEHYSP